MAFYKENQINPAASCLPILAQFPIFIGLFFVLRDFEDEILPMYPDVEPRVARPDRHHRGHEGRLGPAADRPLRDQPADVVVPDVDRTMQPAQRVMLLVLPIAFIPFVLNFPSGLMLYWLTTNLWTTGQGLITRRLDAEAATAAEEELAHAAEGRGRSARRPKREKPAAKQPRRRRRRSVRKVKRKKGGSRR